MDGEMFFEIADYLLNNDYEEAGKLVIAETLQMNRYAEMEDDDSILILARKK